MTTDFQDQDNQFEELGDSSGNRPQPPARGNRPFFIAIGLIGTIFVVALVILLVFMFNKNPQQASGDQAKTVVAYNTQVAASATADQKKVQALQATMDAAAKFTPTPSATVPASATPVVAVATATRTPTPTFSAENVTKTAAAATALAMGTNVGGSGLGTSYPAGTPTATATALPSTGFVDEMGLPGLLAMAAALLVIIFLARRARLSPQ